MAWDHEEQILQQNGITHAEWAVLITAGYYVPFPRGRFIPHAVWEHNHAERYDDVNEATVAAAIESCLTRGWITVTYEGHVERERDVLGEYTGETTEYPEDGITLTDAGHDIHNRIAIGLYGRDYFSS